MQLPSALQSLAVLALLSSSCLLDVLAANYDKPLPASAKRPYGIDMDIGLINDINPKPFPKYSPDLAEDAYGVNDYFFSSYLKFNAPWNNFFSEKELESLAKHAYDEIVEVYVEREINGDDTVRVMPSVMTVLAIGDEIFLASSMKGAGSLAYNSEQTTDGLTNLLNACLLSEKLLRSTANNKHAFDAACGEVQATQLWYRKHPHMNLADQNPTVVAYNGQAQKKIVPPCGNANNGRWGCNRVVIESNMKALKSTGAATLAIEPPKPASMKVGHLCWKGLPAGA